jgi:hypothetical protein
MTIKAISRAAVLAVLASTISAVHAAEPTYKGDPDVYKIIFENADFRVIEAIRKKGVHDKPHGHPVPSVVYNVTDCQARLYAADGKTRDSNSKAGTADAVPVIASHTAENIGPADCKQIFVEKK